MMMFGLGSSWPAFQTSDHVRVTSTGSVSLIVLVVDDDEDSRRIASLALEHAGHTVLTANNGAEGVRLARRHEPDVILMDIAMPVMDGLTAVQQLRANQATRDLPIFAVSARATAHDAEEARRAGFDEYLTKPVQPIEIIAAVNRLRTADRTSGAADTDRNAELR